MAKLGFRVFPLQRHSKDPMRGFLWTQEATADLGQIRRWWRKYPGHNWAMALGANHCALDIDMKDGRDGERALRELQKKHQAVLPETLTSYTGHGGRHLIYSIPKNKQACPSKDKLGPGLEVKTGNHYLARLSGLATDKLDWQQASLTAGVPVKLEIMLFYVKYFVLQST